MRKARQDARTLPHLRRGLPPLHERMRTSRTRHEALTLAARAASTEQIQDLADPRFGRSKIWLRAMISLRRVVHDTAQAVTDRWQCRFRDGSSRSAGFHR